MRVIRTSPWWLHVTVVIGFLVAQFGLFGLGDQSARSATLDEIKARGCLIAATEDDFPPFEFVKDGKPQGLDHAARRVFKKEIPFELRQEILPWQGIACRCRDGKFDLALTAASITDERAQSLAFSMPIAESTYYYVKRKGDDSIKSIQDLSGKRVGITQGSAMQAYLPTLDDVLKKDGGALGEVGTYATYPEAYQDSSEWSARLRGQ